MHLDALVLAELDLGIQSRHDGELHSLVLAVLHVGKRGLTDSLPALVQDRFFIDVREDLLHRVGVEDLGAVEILDHAAGGLALAEAGHRDILAVLKVSLVEAFLEFLGVDVDNDLHTVVFFGCAFDIHGIVPPVW